MPKSSSNDDFLESMAYLYFIIFYSIRDLSVFFFFWGCEVAKMTKLFGSIRPRRHKLV